MATSVGIAAGWRAGVRFSIEGKHPQLLDRLCGATTLNPMGKGGYFPGVKRPGCEADHSPPSSDEVENGEAVSPLPNKS
jgi:hypothetical protein